MLAISGVLVHLGRWYNVIAYTGGFAAGNVVGLFIEHKLAFGIQAILLISREQSAAIAGGLRRAGYAVTEVKGQGMSGEVSLSLVVVPRREVGTVIRVAREIDPSAFCTVEDVRTAEVYVYRSAVPPTGWRAILKKK